MDTWCLILKRQLTLKQFVGIDPLTALTSFLDLAEIGQNGKGHS
jgi:hypothetical protein